MASFETFKRSVPEFAGRVEEILGSHTHHVIGTLRKDGFPRVSGTEIKLHEGELYWGAMPQSRKAQDLQRDPRFSLHSGTTDPPDWQCDAKLLGLAVLVDEEERKAVYPGMGEEQFSLFKADIHEVSVVAVADDRLLVELWHHRNGFKTMQGN